MTLAALGVVFGDIGTSPLYAIRQCFVTGHVAINESTILGILSLIFWCMNLTISFKYVSMIMRADNALRNFLKIITIHTYKKQ